MKIAIEFAVERSSDSAANRGYRFVTRSVNFNEMAFRGMHEPEHLTETVDRLFFASRQEEFIRIRASRTDGVDWKGRRVYASVFLQFRFGRDISASLAALLERLEEADEWGKLEAQEIENPPAIALKVRSGRFVTSTENIHKSRCEFAQVAVGLCDGSQLELLACNAANANSIIGYKPWATIKRQESGNSVEVMTANDDAIVTNASVPITQPLMQPFDDWKEDTAAEGDMSSTSAIVGLVGPVPMSRAPVEVELAQTERTTIERAAFRPLESGPIDPVSIESMPIECMPIAVSPTESVPSGSAPIDPALTSSAAINPASRESRPRDLSEDRLNQDSRRSARAALENHLRRFKETDRHRQLFRRRSALEPWEAMLPSNRLLATHLDRGPVSSESVFEAWLEYSAAVWERRGLRDAKFALALLMNRDAVEVMNELGIFITRASAAALETADDDFVKLVRQFTQHVVLRLIEILTGEENGRRAVK